MTQGVGIVDVANFTAVNNTTLNTIGVSLIGTWKRLMYIIMNAGVGAAGTINAALQSSPNANFSPAHTLNGYTWTTWNTNVPLSSIEIRADQVTQQQSGDKYVRLQLTGAGNALTGVTAVGLGGDAVQKPGGPNYNLNSASIFEQLVVNT